MARQNQTERQHRVQILLPPASMKRLDDLVIKTEAASYAEVTRQALRLYEAVVNETAKGAVFSLERDGVRTPVMTMG
jgi:hypothetical protein